MGSNGNDNNSPSTSEGTTANAASVMPRSIDYGEQPIRSKRVQGEHSYIGYSSLRYNTCASTTRTYFRASSIEWGKTDTAGSIVVFPCFHIQKAMVF